MMNVKRLMELVRPAAPPGVAGEPAGNGQPVRRSSRAAAVDLAPLGDTLGAGGGWANPEYGAYYATSVSVYAAVKLRADAVSRPPVMLYRRSPEGTRMTVAPAHPAQQLLNRVNPWYNPGRPVAGYGDLPEPVGPGFLGLGAG